MLPDLGTGRALRVALYSHDTQGLGHIRRSLAIATALSTLRPRPQVLLLSGARQAASFDLPPGTDLLSLPSIHKDRAGDYHAEHLALPIDELLRLRARTLDAAVEAFQPDLLVVDKVARGFGGELAGTLGRLADDPGTVVVLGLRDVLDAPDVVAREWEADCTIAAIREYYDAVWIYGDPRLYDLASECDFPADVVAKVAYTGYLPPASPAVADATTSIQRPYDLCVLGGGQDGHAVADVFLRAEHPDGVTPVVVAGPYMPDAERGDLQSLARARGAVVLDFVADLAALLAGARTVVSMGGYNASLEALEVTAPVLVVPRVRPRSEQWIRARHFAARGLVDLCHPDEFDPQVLTDWLSATPPRRVLPRPAAVIDMGAATRLAAMAIDAVGAHHALHEELHRAS